MLMGAHPRGWVTRRSVLELDLLEQPERKRVFQQHVNSPLALHASDTPSLQCPPLVPLGKQQGFERPLVVGAVSEPRDGKR